MAAALPASAATLVDSSTAWLAGIGAAQPTGTQATGLFTNTLNLAMTSSIPLADGTTLTLLNTDQLAQPGNGWGAWSNGYAGDVFIPPGGSETITPSSSISALGFDVDPGSYDLGGGPMTFTVTLAGGQALSNQVDGTNLVTDITTTGFFGYYGGPVQSLTISTADPNGFAFGNFVDVPEPASMTLLGLGALAVGMVRRRRG